MADTFSKRYLNSPGTWRTAASQEMFDPPCVIGPGHVGRVGLRKPFRSPLQQGNPYQNYLARQFLGMHQALEYGELDNIFWLPGTENPAGCPAEVKSSMAPCFRMLQSGSLRPRALRPLEGALLKERGRPFEGVIHLFPRYSCFARLLFPYHARLRISERSFLVVGNPRGFSFFPWRSCRRWRPLTSPGWHNRSSRSLIPTLRNMSKRQMFLAW